MREKKKTFFCALFFLTILPFLFTMLFQGIGEVPFLATEMSLQVAERENEQANIEINTPKTKKMLQKAAQKEQENNRILGVLANQIKADAPMEALKAQAVIARTELEYAKSKQEEQPQGKTTKEQKKIWKRSYDANRKRLLQAIEETQDQILMQENQPINAAYHAVSAGKTRSVETESKDASYACLTSAECPLDCESPQFLQVFLFSPDELREILKRQLPDGTLEEKTIFTELQVKKRDSAQYVTQIQVGEKCVTGEEFRSWLSLPSACFYLSQKEEKIRIVTKGVGHGFGLCQYTAAEMAESGKDYLEILQYFFKNVEIKEKDI